MVAAERLVPGTNANIWNAPMRSASSGPSSSTERMRSMCGRFSAHRIARPPITSAIATGTGANSRLRMVSSNMRPATAAGRNARKRLAAKRRDPASEVRPSAVLHNL